MSWASARKPARIEDEAYCLLGIFDINMPLLYGEGPKAFIRPTGRAQNLHLTSTPETETEPFVAETPPEAYAILPIYTDTSIFTTLPLFRWETPKNTIGPIIPLQRDDSTVLWSSSTCLQSSSNVLMLFDFFARIGPRASPSWYAVWGCTMRFGENRFTMRRTKVLLKAQTKWLDKLNILEPTSTLKEKKPQGAQMISSTDEFEIEGEGGPMLVRPFVVSFKELLGSSWP